MLERFRIKFAEGFSEGFGQALGWVIVGSFFYVTWRVLV